MRAVPVFVEIGVSMAYDVGSAAWVFEQDAWGTCGQGTDEGAALRELSRQLGPGTRLEVVERIRGDEQAFQRDWEPCLDAEREQTLAILSRARSRTVDLLRSVPTAALDSEDLQRSLPSFANWRTLRQMAWHIVDTESRDYLPAAGLAAKARSDDLLTELTESAAHVRRQLRQMPADLHVEQHGEVWTAVKLLRRLAWHERGELAVMRTMVERLHQPRSA